MCRNWFVSLIISFCLIYSTKVLSFQWNLPPRVFPKRINPTYKSISRLSMSSITEDSIAKARKEIDDIAQIKEGRTVPLDRYRNIGIMAHIDAGDKDLTPLPLIDFIYSLYRQDNHNRKNFVLYRKGV